jgi:hypothetical protein
VISGFAKSDTIDLAGINETIVSYSVGTLTLGGTTPLALRLPGSFTTRSFLAGTDHKGGTDVTLACFVAGTRIACLDGERTVETLVPGDFVRVVGAECAEIRWIGHRHIDCRRHPRPQDVQPVRVCADAFANGQPHRNLLLSPDHSVFIDGVLIPIRYLINGRTIVQERVDEITYWHIELPEHDVILAEGLPCESYLDTGNRGAFANGGNAVMLHPDFALNVWETQACAELVVSGPKLGAGKGMVLAQAETLGHRVTSDPGLSIVVDGRRLPLHVTGKTGHAILPPDVQSVRLVSRTWVPAHVLAGNDDTRSLGVAIANVRLDGKTLALDDPRLCSGWLEPESGWRWTDGDAGLALAGVRELTFDVVMTGSYWEAPGELEKVQRG